VDETSVKIRGKWRYMYRAIDKHGNPVDFLLTAKRDLASDILIKTSFQSSTARNASQRILL
jgi:transposase-like protein